MDQFEVIEWVIVRIRVTTVEVEAHEAMFFISPTFSDNGFAWFALNFVLTYDFCFSDSRESSFFAQGVEHDTLFGFLLLNELLANELYVQMGQGFRN